jgi:SprT-like family
MTQGEPRKLQSLQDMLGDAEAFSIVRPNDPKQSLTERAYGDLTYAMRFFNERLFDDQLSDCILSFGRLSHVLGYFCPDRFEDQDGALAHEISLNPAYLKTQGDREALSTLVHEMCHLWRHDHGPRNMRGGKGSRGYHDKVWATKMIRVGLTPISLDQPGKTTGYRVTHEIIAGGQFDLDCIELLANGFRIDWHDRSSPLPPEDDLASGDDAAPSKGKKKDRVKFTCCACGLNAWAKPLAKLVCGTCSLIMTSNN